MPASYVITKEILMKRIALDSNSGCWNFTGYKEKQGYGILYADRKYNKAHRVFYERFIGPIPIGNEIHHVCENKGCVNPAHLHPTTKRVHLTELSPNNIMYRNKRKTHCPKGHPLIEGNIKRSRPDWRTCKICSLQSTKDGQARRRMERLISAITYLTK